MFTGLVEATGRVIALEPCGEQARLTLEAPFAAELSLGESVAINGCCLTVTTADSSIASFDLLKQTLAVTSLGVLKPGGLVNLERSLPVGGRLGGHFVQGHVDGAGQFLSMEPLGDGNWWLSVRVPRELLRYLVFKGSIAIDGISLTIAALEDDVVSVAIIPHTYEQTSLGKLAASDRVNIECDVIAKHVERLIQTMDLDRKASLTLEDLTEQGY
jgi:riboflavin synthase